MHEAVVRLQHTTTSSVYELNFFKLLYPGHAGFRAKPPVGIFDLYLITENKGWVSVQFISGVGQELLDILIIKPNQHSI